MFGIFKKKKTEAKKLELAISHRVENNNIDSNSKNNNKVEENISGEVSEIVTPSGVYVGEKAIDIFTNPNPPTSWLDRKTNLIWEIKNPNNYEDKYTYDEALKYAEKLNAKHYGNSSKWRVPSVDEILSLGAIKLYDYRSPHATLAGRTDWKKRRLRLRNGKLFVKKPLAGFMNTQAETWYWSATSLNRFQDKEIFDKAGISIELAWTVSFFEGSNFHQTKAQKNHVICVRNNPKKMKKKEEEEIII